MVTVTRCWPLWGAGRRDSWAGGMWWLGECEGPCGRTPTRVPGLSRGHTGKGRAHPGLGQATGSESSASCGFGLAYFLPWHEICSEGPRWHLRTWKKDRSLLERARLRMFALEECWRPPHLSPHLPLGKPRPREGAGRGDGGRRVGDEAGGEAEGASQVKAPLPWPAVSPGEGEKGDFFF